ncbi:MAG: hypothetical protein M1450_02390 [Patescibacteria group bacterium]|nr:hypothetical protein [Patescibacteria group bacterium]
MIIQKNTIVILFLTLILVVAWIALSVYHHSVTSTISKDFEAQVVPIYPDFDTKALEIIKLKKRVEPSFQYQGVSEEENKATQGATPTITQAAGGKSLNE